MWNNRPSFLVRYPHPHSLCILQQFQEVQLGIAQDLHWTLGLRGIVMSHPYRAVIIVWRSSAMNRPYKLLIIVTHSNDQYRL